MKLVVLIPQKIVLVLVDEKKYPKKIEFNPQNVKKGGQNGGTSISPNIEGVPSPGAEPPPQVQPLKNMSPPPFNKYTDRLHRKQDEY